MDLSLRYKINAPHIVHEIFADEEAAIINLKSGNYYSLDPVGAFLWAHIESGLTVGEIVEQALSRYEGAPVEVNHEISRFLGALQEEQLIVAATEATGQPVKTPANGNGAKIAFSPPVLERYNDMQELLLLDPIHEVDETGWPHRKQEN